MFDYLEQFKRLPKELREKISSPAAMAVLSELEKKYNLALAATVMKVMVKILSVRDLSSHFISDFSLTPEAARNLSNELRERLFFVVAGYLGLKKAPSNDENTVTEIIKNSQLSFPSNDLSNRARHVILTYLRGVRSKIDARDVLEKPINNGGLNLNREDSSRLLREVDNISAKTTAEASENSASQEVVDKGSGDDLQKIIDKHEKQESYDLKKELVSGRTASLLATPDIKQLEAKTESSTSSSDQTALDKRLEQKTEQTSTTKPSELNELEKKLLSKKLESDDSEDLDELMRQISVDKKSEKLSTNDGQADKVSQVDKDKLIAVEVKPSPEASQKPETAPDVDSDVSKEPLVDTSIQAPAKFAPPPKKSFFARLFSRKKEATTPKINIDQPKATSPQLDSKKPAPQLKDKKLPEKSVDQPTKLSQPSLASGQATTHADRLTDKLRADSVSTPEKTIKPSEPVIEKTINKNISQADKLAPNFINKPSGMPHRAAAGSDFKPKIEDIKAAPKIMGPIEELRYLDLVNFRRLGPPPEEATNKIKAKIKLMEKEGYDRRLAAVAAWRKSPVSRLYIAIGQEAVGQGITMKEAALARKEKKQDYLSWEEIRAIVELNSSLMF